MRVQTVFGVNSRFPFSPINSSLNQSLFSNNEVSVDQVRFSSKKDRVKKARRRIFQKRGGLDPAASFHILGIMGEAKTTPVNEELLKHVVKDRETWQANAEKNPSVKYNELNAKVIVPQFLKAIGNVKDLNILDMGCGKAADFTLVLAPMAKKIVAVDFVGKNIELAKKNLAELNRERAKQPLPPLQNVYFYEESVSNLQNLKPTGHFEDNSFDKVISKMVFHGCHPLVYSAAVDEAFRLLKPGGQFVFIVKHPDLHRKQAIVEKSDDIFFPGNREFLNAVEHIIGPKNRHGQPLDPDADRTTVYTYHAVDYLVPIYNANFGISKVTPVIDTVSKNSFPSFLIIEAYKPNDAQKRYLDDQKALFRRQLRRKLSMIPSVPPDAPKHPLIRTFLGGAASGFPLSSGMIKCIYQIVEICSETLPHESAEAHTNGAARTKKYNKTKLLIDVTGVQDPVPKVSFRTAGRSVIRYVNPNKKEEANPLKEFKAFISEHYRRATGENF